MKKPKTRLGRVILAFIIILCGILLGLGMYLKHPKFGRLPEGNRLQRIEQSPHYREGAFRNLEPIPHITENSGFVTALARYLFSSKEGRLPPSPIPSVKTDLLSLDPAVDLIVWLGHSSYFIQLGGKRILVDPVFSAYASPIWFANRAFPGASPYNAGDMPEIDYLLISHDHWDHLDYQTVMDLKEKVGKVVTPLGVGSHLEYWGYDPDRILEGEWYESFIVEDGLTVHILPARHFSGRALTRDKTLWAGFALESMQRRIFFSGDGGYGAHFKSIGEAFQGFDAVMLDAGQYDEGWRYVHMNPEEASKAAVDVNARAFLPAHSGKFSIAYHAWDDPYVRLAKASDGKAYDFLTPVIGEVVRLDAHEQRFGRWWEKVARSSPE